MRLPQVEDAARRQVTCFCPPCHVTKWTHYVGRPLASPPDHFASQQACRACARSPVGRDYMHVIICSSSREVNHRPQNLTASSLRPLKRRPESSSVPRGKLRRRLRRLSRLPRGRLRQTMSLSARSASCQSAYPICPVTRRSSATNTTWNRGDILADRTCLPVDASVQLRIQFTQFTHEALQHMYPYGGNYFCLACLYGHFLEDGSR